MPCTTLTVACPAALAGAAASGTVSAADASMPVTAAVRRRSCFMIPPVESLSSHQAAILRQGLSRDCREIASKFCIVLPVEDLVRIGELARRTGVSPELLRAWELRYGLLQPKRSSGGFRLYSATDEERVRQMRRLIADGLSAAEAARQARTMDPAQPAAEKPVVKQLADQLRTALDRFDDSGAHTALDRLLATVSVEITLTDVVIPYLRELGDRWAAGR